MIYDKVFEIQYIGNITYYKKLLKYSHIVFEQYEPHQKTSFNNRCWIAGANGPILLSIPLEKGRLQTTPLKDIRICNDEKWQKKHWRSILSSYNASPWFSYFTDSMADLYSTPYTFLIDWNLSCINWIIKNLAVDLQYELTKNQGQAGINWEALKTDSRGQTIDHDFRYQQVFESKTGFIPGLSIIDLLFCVGPRMAVSLLKSGGLNEVTK